MNQSPLTKRPLTKEESNKVRDNLGLVWKIAGKMTRNDQDFHDMVNYGSIALAKAVVGFDESRGVSFASYAVPKIVGALRRINFTYRKIVHIPAYLDSTNDKDVKFSVIYSDYAFGGIKSKEDGPETTAIKKSDSTDLMQVIEIASGMLQRGKKRGSKLSRYPYDIGKQIILRCVMGDELLSDIGREYDVTPQMISVLKVRMLSHIRTILEDEKAA